MGAITQPRPSAADLKAQYEELVKQVADLRGRELFYKFIGSGAGNGPFIELADGSVKYDLITGIGVNFFGHGNLELFEAEIDSLWCHVMQGNLGPNPEYGALMKELLSLVGAKSRLKHVWLTTCGATANEIALKIVRQKKFPASKIMAFKECFAGRTTALQEITDNARYREGQPTYGEVHYLPFFNQKSTLSATDQAAGVITSMKEEFARQPGRFACLEFEIVQGEGGFNAAPREFLLPIIEEAKRNGLAIWVDEIQTFGRTGEVFCYQRLGLDEHIDVATVAKLLQTGAVLYTQEYNPKAGLISGTFAGSSGGLRAGRKGLELLKTKLAGPNGRIRQLEKLSNSEFERIKAGPNGKHLVDYTVIGGMIAFTLFDGTLDQAKKYLFKLWDLGAIAFYCGHGPYRIRMLPPFGVMTDEQLRHVFKLFDEAITETARELRI
ncbi:MAG: aminotransferase class III-fold pyridoxal phosphate-dependent enzyme [Deltaproteobacteria bacterium]|nr:aminotransferase class III-fold pyridoxal phosphate-dependent enzyme [Deltaproteobacteria bacterium]